MRSEKVLTERGLKRGSKVKAIQIMSRPRTSNFFRSGRSYDPTSAPYEIAEWYLSLKGSHTYKSIFWVRLSCWA